MWPAAAPPLWITRGLYPGISVACQHMKRRLSTRRGVTIVVDALVPNPDVEHDPLPEQILGIALDQRAFGPRKLMVAFGTYDGDFLALTYAGRTQPMNAALEACLLHFDTIGRGGHTHAAAVVLCDEPVKHGPPPSAFLDKFKAAQEIARRHRVHLVDWIGCDDDLFRCARRREFTPTPERGWWNVPDLPEGA